MGTQPVTTRFQPVFLPIDNPVSPNQAATFAKLVLGAEKSGLPIKVAVISSKYDLGSVPILFGTPQRYADFLGQELFYYYKQKAAGRGAPNGYGIYDHGRPTAAEQAVLAKLPPAHSANGDVLAAAATRAVEALAKQQGVIRKASTASGSSSTNQERLEIGGAALVVILLAGVSRTRGAAGDRDETRRPLARPACLCAGCGGSKAPTYSSGAQVLPSTAAPTFTLHDAAGNAVSLTSPPGHYVIVTFLYTHCPDVCPIIAGNLNSALKTPTAKRAGLTVLAVSVDPKGDTATDVRKYIQERGLVSKFQYLIGSQSQLAPVWKSFNIASVPGANGVVTHSSYEFLIDPKGHERLLCMARARSAGVDRQRPEDADEGELMPPRRRRTKFYVGLAGAMGALVVAGVFAVTHKAPLSVTPPATAISAADRNASAALVHAAAGVGFHPVVLPGIGKIEDKPASAAKQGRRRNCSRSGQLRPTSRCGRPEGKTVSLRDYRGKATLLEFFATWCPHCDVEAPHLRKLYNSLPRKGYGFVSVNVDGEDAPSVFAYHVYFGLPFPALLDPSSKTGNFNSPGSPGKVTKAYGIQSFPTSTSLMGRARSSGAPTASSRTPSCARSSSVPRRGRRSPLPFLSCQVVVTVHCDPGGKPVVRTADNARRAPCERPPHLQALRPYRLKLLAVTALIKSSRLPSECGIPRRSCSKTSSTPRSGRPAWPGGLPEVDMAQPRPSRPAG